MDWMKYIWSHKCSYNELCKNLLEISYHLWAIWNHRNNVIFRSHKCNPIYVIKLAKNTFLNTLLYNKSINVDDLEVVIGSKVNDTDSIHSVKHWDLPMGWLKWNTDASRLKATHSITISCVCRANTG